MWYKCERKDLGDAQYKCVRVALLTGRRVLLAVTARRAELPRVVPPPSEPSSTGSSFRLLRVFDLDTFLAQCAETPVEWHDRDCRACWARFAVLPAVGDGRFGVRIAWQCSSDASETCATVTVDASQLTVLSEVSETSASTQCAVECSFGAATPEEAAAMTAGETVCSAVIAEDSAPCSVPELATAECFPIRVEQIAPVEATQDVDVLNGAMTQRFAVRVRVHNQCDRAVSIQDLSATIRSTAKDAQWQSRVVVGVPGGADGKTAWLEDTGPIAVAPNDVCDLVWSAKVMLQNALPGHDEATRCRAHATLGPEVAVDFVVKAAREDASEPQKLLLHTVFVNPSLVLPTRDSCAAQTEALALAGFPCAQLVDWCACDDVETLCRHYVSVCPLFHHTLLCMPSRFVFQMYRDASAEGMANHTLLLHVSEQPSGEFYVLDKEFYQSVVLAAARPSTEDNGFRVVPAVSTEQITVSVLVSGATQRIVALRVEITAKTSPASCVHFFCF